MIWAELRQKFISFLYPGLVLPYTGGTSPGGDGSRNARRGGTGKAICLVPARGGLGENVRPRQAILLPKLPKELERSIVAAHSDNLKRVPRQLKKDSM
jgi:hypothetical protein